MSILKRQVNFPSSFSSFFRVITHNSSVLFSLCIFYFGKEQILTLPSVLIKIFQIAHVNFQTANQFFFQTLHDISVSWRITPLYFFKSNVMYFARKGPIKVQTFENFECLDQNPPNFCHFWNNKLFFFLIFHHSSVSWDITSLYFLAEILNTFNKKSLSKYKFDEITREQSKV